MAAPSGTIWGSTVGSYGRIGLYVDVTTNNSTTYAGNVQVWFWSKYGVSDSSNTLYYDNLSASGSATTSKGSVDVNTTVSSGEGWSTSNQKLLKTISFSHSKGTSAAKRYIYAKLTNIDRVGGTMSASTTFSVPTLASYTITYNANGGSGAPSSQTKWHGKAITLSSTKPTRSGYSFQGWATSASGSVAYSPGASYTGNAALKLYAVWKANTYTVSYNANGGSGAPQNQTKTHGVALTLSSTKPTRTNYTFKGWGTSANATTATYQAGGSYTANANVTLYAIWQLSYTTPKISNLSATRCDSGGTSSDEGQYARIKFSWSSSQSVSSIVVNWSPATGSVSSATISASGTSGSVDTVVGNGQFDAEKSYSFTVVVTDGGGNTDRSVSMSGTEYHIDASPDNGIAIGKPSEPFYNPKGNHQKVFDVNWLAKIRNHICIGDKIGHLDGKTGILLSDEGYMHLQRTTAQGYNAYIGFLMDDETEVTAQIRHNCQNRWLEFLGANTYKMDNQMRSFSKYFAVAHEHPTSGKVLAFGYTGDGTNGGIYDATNSRWVFKLNGDHLYLGAACGEFKPYYTAGDSYTHIIRTAGYVTNSKAEVHFTVPISKPIVGSTAVSAASVNGFILRQGDKYTHGSAASTYAKPTSYSCAICGNGTHLAIVATFSNTTNAINNDAIGIYANFTLTFS